MKVYSIVKNNSINLLDENLDLQNGYRFNHKYDITLYNKEITKEILSKKVKNSLKKILELLNNSDDDDDTSMKIMIKIETLRKLIMENYLRYLGKSEIKVYLLELSNLESKITTKKKKRR